MNRSRSATAQSSIRLARLLIGSFALTIASFVAATLLSAYRAHGIQTAAESITTNALPSVACYSRTRTELRQMEMLLERITGSSVPGREKTTPAMLRRSRDTLENNWATCIALPNYPEEEDIQQQISALGGQLSVSIDAVLRRLEEDDREGAVRILYSETEPIVDRVDNEIVETINLNVRQSTMRGAEIAALRTASQRTLTVLLGLSTILAGTAAVVMVRVLGRFTALMESRISEMEQFAGRVAHDIRSPLSAVGIALELTKRDPQLGVERGFLDRATRTVHRIGQLVDGLLLFARAGATSPEGAEADIAPVIEGVLEEMRPLAEENGVELTTTATLPSSRVACSPGVLISVLSNLVGNAIKHMGATDEINVTIEARDVERAVRFEVQDTGPGISPDMRARVFDPYVRAAASTTPGLGLGLATVRRLVLNHGGTVGVLPSKEVGSTFWFELPKATVIEHHHGAMQHA